MTRLVITRGLPGSGKSTRARAWVAEDPARRARVNRDDLRGMIHDGVWLGQDTERQIVSARDALVRSLLAKGLDVVVDETCLPQRKARDLARIALLAGAELEVWDLTDVPLEECLRRNKARERLALVVPEHAILDMHARYLAGRSYPLPLPEEPDGGDLPEPYVPVPGTPKAILVDVDGTVALHGTRSPYDETRVHEDRPNQPVIAVVQALYGSGCDVLFASGRTEGCRVATEKWIDEHVGVDYEALHMRPADDKRKDAVVKLEIFDRQIRDRYDVVAVLDDRNQVVEMWRSIGLTVLQVAEGDF